MKCAATAALSCLWVSTSAVAASPSESPPLKPYVAKKVSLPPKSAKYLMPDGSILIAGNDLMASYMEKLIALFRKSHPDFKFHLEMHTSGLSVSGINSGKSALHHWLRKGGLHFLGPARGSRGSDRRQRRRLLQARDPRLYAEARAPADSVHDAPSTGRTSLVSPHRALADDGRRHQRGGQ